MIGLQDLDHRSVHSSVGALVEELLASRSFSSSTSLSDADLEVLGDIALTAHEAALSLEPANKDSLGDDESRLWNQYSELILAFRRENAALEAATQSILASLRPTASEPSESLSVESATNTVDPDSDPVFSSLEYHADAPENPSQEDERANRTIGAYAEPIVVSLSHGLTSGETTEKASASCDAIFCELSLVTSAPAACSPVRAPLSGIPRLRRTAGLPGHGYAHSPVRAKDSHSLTPSKLPTPKPRPKNAVVQDAPLERQEPPVAPAPKQETAAVAAVRSALLSSTLPAPASRRIPVAKSPFGRPLASPARRSPSARAPASVASPAVPTMPVESPTVPVAPTPSKHKPAPVVRTTAAQQRLLLGRSLDSRPTGRSPFASPVPSARSQLSKSSSSPLTTTPRIPIVITPRTPIAATPLASALARTTPSSLKSSPVTGTQRAPPTGRALFVEDRTPEKAAPPPAADEAGAAVKVASTRNAEHDVQAPLRSALPKTASALSRLQASRSPYKATNGFPLRSSGASPFAKTLAPAEKPIGIADKETAVPAGMSTIVTLQAPAAATSALEPVRSVSPRSAVTVPEKVAEIFARNLEALWLIYMSYCSSLGLNYAEVASQRKQHSDSPLIGLEDVWSLLRDFDICPLLCSKHRIFSHIRSINSAQSSSSTPSSLSPATPTTFIPKAKTSESSASQRLSRIPAMSEPSPIRVIRHTSKSFSSPSSRSEQLSFNGFLKLLWLLAAEDSREDSVETRSTKFLLRLESGRSKMSSKNNKSVKNLPAFSLDTSFLNTPPKKDADRSSAGVSTYFDVRDESHILDV